MLQIANPSTGDARPPSAGLLGRMLRAPTPRTLFAAVTVAFVYSLTARLGLALALPTAPVAALWAPNAVLLAALLLARRSTWWIFLALVLPGHFLVQLLGGYAPDRVLIQYVFNCATALVGAATLTRLVPNLRRIERVRSALLFILTCALLAPLLTSLLTAAAFLAAHVDARFWLTVSARTLSNSFAILTIVPLILHAAAWLKRPQRTVQLARAVEAGLLATSLILLAALGLLAPAVLSHNQWVFVYALFAILLWASVRFGVVGACASVLTLGGVATLGVLAPIGPVLVGSPARNVLWLLLFLILSCVTVLLLAAAIEERRQLEQVGSESEARFRTIFAQNLMPTLIWHSDGSLIDANESFFRLTGYTRADLRSGTVHARALFARADGTRLGDADPEAGLSLGSGPVERALVLRDGHHIPVLVGAFMFAGSDQEGTAYVLDLSSLRRAESERRHVDRLHSAVLASIHDQMVVLDQSGVIIEANQSWRRYVEHSATRPFERANVGDQYLQVCAGAAREGDPVAAELLECIRDVLAGTSAQRRLEFSRERPEGPLWYEMSVEPLSRPEGGVIITRADITAAKQAMSQAQEQRLQLAHLGRAAVLGELSGAFAHELTQPLTSILGNAEAALELISREPSSPPVIAEMLRDIIRDDVRAAEVIQRLRSMLARGEIQRQPIDLNQVVRDVLALAHSDLITRNVSVALQLSPQTPFVLADAVQLQQVLLNLVMNACDAMTGSPAAERRLTIATRFVEGGRAVECAVADRGCGVPGDQLERIFQPFVTTKKHGLGLGLPICRSIIEAHGGRLWAENREERGAVFRFTASAGR